MIGGGKRKGEIKKKLKPPQFLFFFTGNGRSMIKDGKESTSNKDWLKIIVIRGIRFDDNRFVTKHKGIDRYVRVVQT